MGLFDKIKSATNTIAEVKEKITSEPQQKSTTLKIEGFFQLKEADLMELLNSNPNFELSTKELVEKGYGGKRVYKFFSEYDYGISLIPEPGNQYDKDAVMVAMHGRKIGYIPRDNNIWVKRLLKKNAINNMKVTVKGGPIRKIYSNGTSMAYFNDYDPKITIEYFG